MLDRIVRDNRRYGFRLGPAFALSLVALAAGSAFGVIGAFPSAFYRVLPTPTYLTTHTILEMASILVSFSIFAVNWQASRQKHNSQGLFIGVAFLTVATIDTMHLLSYSGMPDFVTPNSVGKAIVYHLAARLTEATALFIAALLSVNQDRRSVNRWVLLGLGLAVAGAVFVATTYFWDYLPPLYVDGRGLTPLKVNLEHVVIGLNAGALTGYWLTSRGRPSPQTLTLMSALVVVIFAELAFTLYTSAYDTFNLLGHLYKAVAYYLVFRSLFVTSIEHPYRELAHANVDLARATAELRQRNQELGERYAQLEALTRVSAEVAGSLDVRTVCDSVLGHCRRLTGARCGFLGLLGDGVDLEVISVQEDGPRSCPLASSQEPSSELLRCVYGSVVARGRAIRSNNVKLDLQEMGASPCVPGPESFLGVPLTAKGRVIGLIGLANRTGGFDASDEWLVTAFANQTAVAIENARLHETERRLVELEQLKTIVDQLPSGVVIADSWGRFTLANRMAEQLFRWPVPYGAPPETYPEALHFLHPETGELYPGSELPLVRSAVHREVCADVEIAVQWPDGQRRTLLWNTAPLLDEEERIAGAVGAFRDISEIKELDRMKDEFLSIASHELRSPLTAARGYAQLMLRKLRGRAGSDADVHALQVIDHQIGRVSGLVGQLLDASRAQMGRLDLEPRPTDLVKLARGVVEQFQMTARGHVLSVETASAEVVGRWDSGRLEQVLSNLVGNAIKYSPEGGQVAVTILAGEGEVQVSVSDQGLGIPREAQARLFERYSRVHGESRIEGLGLGLYITRQIIEQHGGRIWVESEPGQGSTFHFVLPVESSAPSRA